MPTNKDGQWLQAIGGRTVETKEAKPDGKLEEGGLVGEILQAQKEALKVKAVGQVLGLSGPAIPPSQDLATNIVTKSMDVTDKIIKDLQVQSAGLQGEVVRLQKELMENISNFFKERMDRINDKAAQVDAAAQKAAASGAPKSAFDYYHEVREQLRVLMEEMPRPEARETRAGMSDETVITLKKLELDQTRTLSQLQADAARAKQEWDLKFLQFQEESKQRWAAYNDKKQIMQEGVSGLQDVMQALGKSISAERGVSPESGAGAGAGSPARASPPPAAPGAGGPPLHMSVSRFPCQYCQTPIEVQPGQTEVTCPQCSTEYGM